MSRRVLVAMEVAVAAALAVGAAGCATSGSGSAASASSAPSTSASGTSASAALCSAADDVRTSLGALGDIDVLTQGADALEQAWTQVKSDIGALADAARAQHSEEVQQVKTDSDALDAALDQARANPSAQTLGAAATAAGALARDTQALLADVSSSC